MTNAVKTDRPAGRKLGLWGAGFAAMLALAMCTGCDKRIRSDIRQGAYEVFSAGLDTFYSELSSGITTGIGDLASKTP